MTRQNVLLDVREDLRSGRSPCSRILSLAGRLEEGDTIRLIAPFEPIPLYEVLRHEGFVHESRDLGGGDWEVRFTKDSRMAMTQAPTSMEGDRQAGCGCARPSGDPERVELDVRGLEPPQPMVRILERLAALPQGAELRALTDRRPLHLYDQLEARGFNAASEENPGGGYLTVIRRP